MNHPEALQAGTRLDDYEIAETLWKTNAGLIYRARELDRDRDVLIQEYLPAVLATRHWSGIHAMPLEELDEEFAQGLSAFLREARILAQINDPYVCRVYEYIEANATAYMVLDYEPGRTLSEQLAERRAPLGEGEIRRLLVPLLKGLRAVHAGELLHRDIHPGNVYVRDVGPPVLIGFGSPASAPRDPGEPHVESRIAPGYSPVEQYQSDGRLGPWSDLYALGATMYRCLSGTTPVEATRRVTEIAQDEEDPLVPATELGVSDYGAALLGAIDWMMEPMAAGRPETAGAVLGPLTEDRAMSEAASTGAQPPARAAAVPAPSPDPGPKRRRAPAPALSGHRPTPATPSLGGAAQRGWPAGRPGIRWAAPAAALAAGVVLAAVWALQPPPASRDMAAGGAAPAAGTPAEAPAPSLELPNEVNFGRENDDQRAAEYRGLEQQANRIAQALAAADKNLRQGRLISPAGDNALAGYRSVLAMDPDQVDARAGLRTIQERLVASAETAFEAEKISEAKRLLDRAAEIGEPDGRSRTLRAEIEQYLADKARQKQLAREAEREREAVRRRAEQARRERIDTLVARAETAFDAGDLTQPPGDNALAYYRRALALAPDNAAAQQGVTRIGRQYLDRASNALARDELDQAEGLLNTAAAILPNSESVPLLKQQVATRREVLAREERVARAARAHQEREAAQTRAEAAGAENDKAAAGKASRDLEEGVAAYYRGDYDIAQRLLDPLAQQGNARAMFRLAMMYHHGRGVALNVDHARALIREALPEIRAQVAADSAWAQADLASLYADGILLAENEAKAVRLYTLAAEQGYAGAQTNLGVMYANGEGVTRDRDVAIAWLQRAAAQGDLIAQRNLQSLGVQ